MLWHGVMAQPVRQRSDAIREAELNARDLSSLKPPQSRYVIIVTGLPSLLSTLQGARFRYDVRGQILDGVTLTRLWPLASTCPARRQEGKEMTMATTKKHTPRGLKQDRREIAAKQPYEVEYEAKKMGVKPAVVRKAVKKVGHSRAKVEVAIKSGKV